MKKVCCQIHLSYQGSGPSTANTCQWKNCLPPTIDCWVNIRCSNRSLHLLDDAFHGISERYRGLMNDRTVCCVFHNLVTNLVHSYPCQKLTSYITRRRLWLVDINFIIHLDWIFTEIKLINNLTYKFITFLVLLQAALSL